MSDGVMTMMGIMSALGVVFFLAWLLIVRKPREKGCANKGRDHRYHEWSQWTMTDKIDVYRKLSPPTGFVGHEIHLARRCDKCGLPDTMIEKTWI